MSNNYQDWNDDLEDDFEDDFEEQLTPPRRSSGDDVVKKLRRSDRSKEKRIKELEGELGSLRKTQRDSIVKSVLEQQGISPKIAAFIPQDLEITTEALQSWIEEYADVFGVAPVQSQDIESNVDLAGLRQIDMVTADAMSPDKMDDLYLRLNQAESADDILSMIYGAE